MMKSKCLSIFLLVLNTFLFVKSYADQIVPQSFAFQTVTHTRAGDYTLIEKHINWYASMDCPIATELNIVWNNEIEPDKAPIKFQKNEWRRPVYFFKTPSNSMDWRYKLSPQSKAKVYFIADDDVRMGCEQLSRGFKIWQDNAIGNVGPIVSYAVRYFDYTSEKGFHYGKKSPKYYSIGLVGVSFMSRHFMQLYYAELYLLQEMRKIVREKNNCDDIGLNWLIQYFYPELETIYVEALKGNPLANSPAVAQSTSKDHYIFRGECVKSFTDLFGITALRYKPVVDTAANKQIRIKPLKEKIVASKWMYLDAIIKGKPTGETLATDRNASSDEYQSVIQKLQSKLLEALKNNQMLQQKAMNLQIQLQHSQDKNRVVSSSEKIQNIEQNNDKKVFHKIPLTQILSVCIVSLVLIIAYLIYKLIGSKTQNKFLHLRENQVNAVQATSFDSTE